MTYWITAGVATGTDRYDVQTDPPEEPLCCGLCMFCKDVGIVREEGGICVRLFEETGSYDDIRYVGYDCEICESYREA